MNLSEDIAKVKELSSKLTTGLHNRDYEDSLRSGEALFEMMPDYMTFHMVLLSLFRLDWDVSKITRYFDRMRPKINLTPWQEVLVMVTAGMLVEIQDLLTAPDITEEKRCQLCYYMGCRMVYVGTGQAEYANQFFTISAIADAKCLEKSLAMGECETRGISYNDGDSGRFFHGTPQRQAVMQRCDPVTALLKAGHWAEALPLAKNALTLALQTLGENYITTANSHNLLGAALRGLGRLREALPHFEAAHQIQRRVLGVRSLHVIKSLENLAEVHRPLGNSAAASRCLEEVLKIRRVWKE